MTFWDFWHQHTFLAFVAIIAVYSIIYAAVTVPFRLVNRWIRHRNIVAKGWPPGHLDADGDWKPEKD